MDKVWLEADCSRYEFFKDVVDQTTPDVAIVNIDSDDEAALSLIGNLTQDYPNCGVIVVSSRTDGQLILRAMRRNYHNCSRASVFLDAMFPATRHR